MRPAPPCPELAAPPGAAAPFLDRIWRRYKGPVKKDGPNVDTEAYAFLTTTPNPLVATINHERMPVLLTREAEFQTWLAGSPDEAFALAREYAPDQMRIVQEGLDQQRTTFASTKSPHPSCCLWYCSSRASRCL